MAYQKIIYKNRLPHITPVGAQFFITFRLVNSLPFSIFKEKKERYEQQLAEINKKPSSKQKNLLVDAENRYFEDIDNYLDQNNNGECYLKNPKIAQLVADRIKEYDGVFYDLQAFCIMPNHVHLLIDTYEQIRKLGLDGLNFTGTPEGYTPLHEIMRLIKGGTSKKANESLGRRGQFWQKDSFDRYIRDEKHWNATIEYIVNNPVKARLIKSWEDWTFTYCKIVETTVT